jgi:hypothetical protein
MTVTTSADVPTNDAHYWHGALCSSGPVTVTAGYGDGPTETYQEPPEAIVSAECEGCRERFWRFAATDRPPMICRGCFDLRREAGLAADAAPYIADLAYAGFRAWVEPQLGGGCSAVCVAVAGDLPADIDPRDTYGGGARFYVFFNDACTSVPDAETLEIGLSIYDAALGEDGQEGLALCEEWRARIADGTIGR